MGGAPACAGEGGIAAMWATMSLCMSALTFLLAISMLGLPASSNLLFSASMKALKVFADDFEVISESLR